MTGNVVIDVFIGLAFIYLLYSLFATVIMELINSIIGLRSQNLVYTLKRMLKDEAISGKFKIFFSSVLTSILSFFGMASNLMNSKLYKTFIDQPSIKYLSSGSFKRKPSYLSPRNFSKALIDSLKDEGKVDFGKDAKNHSSVTLIKKGIEILYKKEDKNKNRFSLFFKKIFSWVPRKQETNDDLPSDTAKHLNSLLEDANNDLVKFRLLVEEWFDNTMERSMGWYKRKTQFILIIVGFIIAIAFNANTFDIIKRLSKDDKARGEMVKLASAYVQENQELIGKIIALDTTGKNDSIKDFKVKIDSILKVKDLLEDDINTASTILNLGWPKKTCYLLDSISYYDTLIQKAERDTTIALKFPNDVDKEQFKKFIQKERRWTWLIKNRSFKWWTVCRNFWGYFLTAMAISLGAPFWFDLLNKLIKLKSSVGQATENTGKKKKTNPNDLESIQNRVG